jgi:hypothetical protein
MLPFDFDFDFPPFFLCVKFECNLIFFLFQLLLMKRGGQVIYAGSLGHRSHKLIEYFEVTISPVLFPSMIPLASKRIFPFF